MKKLKLNVLKKDEMQKRNMMHVKGGTTCCCCACNGPSNINANYSANDDQCLESPECPE